MSELLSNGERQSAGSSFENDGGVKITKDGRKVKRIKKVRLLTICFGRDTMQGDDMSDQDREKIVKK